MTLHFALMLLWSGGCRRHWSQDIKEHAVVDGEISRSRGGEGIPIEACNFMGNLSFDWQPVKLSMGMWRYIDFKTG